MTFSAGEDAADASALINNQEQAQPCEFNRRNGKDSRLRDPMTHPTGFASAWIVMHLAAIVISLMVRMHLASRFEGLIQCAFLVSLTMIGLSTVIGYYECLEMWPVSAVTLSLMIVMAIVDFDSNRSLSANFEA